MHMWGGGGGGGGGGGREGINILHGVNYTVGGQLILG